MNIPGVVSNTHFVQFNLMDLLEQLGEDEVKSILSSFMCPQNPDIEIFLKSKAIEFAKRGFAKTHLVYWETEDGTEKELVGYYAIALKPITIQRDVLSNSAAKKLREQGIYDQKLNMYTVAAHLIGQLGKNYNGGSDTLIDGEDLLQMAMDKIKLSQKETGGRFVYLECEDVPELIKFYERNHFQMFGKRNLDRDETDIRGHYLLQYFTIL